jgi:hypothetical protein
MPASATCCYGRKWRRKIAWIRQKPANFSKFWDISLLQLLQAPVQGAQLSTDFVKQGEETLFVGFAQNFDMVMAKTSVTNIANLAIPLDTSVPRYRATHIDAINVDKHLGSQCPFGVLISEDGVVQAMSLNYLDKLDKEYYFGLATPSFLPMVTQIQNGTLPKLRYRNPHSSDEQGPYPGGVKRVD